MDDFTGTGMVVVVLVRQFSRIDVMWLDKQILRFCGWLDNHMSFIDKLFQEKPKKKRGKRK